MQAAISIGQLTLLHPHNEFLCDCILWSGALLSWNTGGVFQGARVGLLGGEVSIKKNRPPGLPFTAPLVVLQVLRSIAGRAEDISLHVTTAHTPGPIILTWEDASRDSTRQRTGWVDPAIVSSFSVLALSLPLPIHHVSRAPVVATHVLFFFVTQKMLVESTKAELEIKRPAQKCGLQPWVRLALTSRKDQCFSEACNS